MRAELRRGCGWERWMRRVRVGPRGFGAGLDDTEGDETVEGACRQARAAHTAPGGASHATGRDICREK